MAAGCISTDLPIMGRIEITGSPTGYRRHAVTLALAAAVAAVVASVVYAADQVRRWVQPP